MKKKTIANIVMVGIILVIFISSLLFVGNIKGWFDKPSENTTLLTDFRGIITLERDGIAYTTTEDTILRNNDKITSNTGSTVKIYIGNGYITLGQNTTAKIKNSNSESFHIEVIKGEAFVDTVTPILFEFDTKKIEIKDTVATLSIRSGAQSISVYYGSVNKAKPGQMLEWISDDMSVRDFSINSLNDFNISQIRKANASKALVFTNDDLDKLEAERLAQMQNTNDTDDTITIKHEETTKSSESINQEETTKPSESIKQEETTKPQESTKQEESTKPSESINQEETTKPQESTKQEETTKPENTEPKLTCTITIRCDTILNNWNELDTAKAPYVPESGCILPVVTVEFTKGETVFDVLNRVCKEYGIQIEYSWTPMYNSYYIEGINNLYEFDCGPESGWMYKVNGWFPNYGCSSYNLIGGETIVWSYTCKGLGEDVGAGRWE